MNPFLRWGCWWMNHQTTTRISRFRRVHLGGVEFAVVQLEDAQGRLQVGLGLGQLQLDGPQTVGIRGGQVHPQQRQIHLKDRRQAYRSSLQMEATGQTSDTR